MKTESTKVIKISSQEQHENIKNTRKKLRVLQESANDKENLAGRSISKDVDTTEFRKKKQLVNKAVQTGEATITAEDLVNDEPGVDYWKQLAETRQGALDRSLQENEALKVTISSLEEENRICKDMIEESKHLIEVLQEMIQEDDTTEVAEDEP